MKFPTSNVMWYSLGRGAPCVLFWKCISESAHNRDNYAVCIAGLLLAVEESPREWRFAWLKTVLASWPEPCWISGSRDCYFCSGLTAQAKSKYVASKPGTERCTFEKNKRTFPTYVLQILNTFCWVPHELAFPLNLPPPHKQKPLSWIPQMKFSSG